MVWVSQALKAAFSYSSGARKARCWSVAVVQLIKMCCDEDLQVIASGCLSPCWCYGLPSVITSLCLLQQSLDKCTERNLLESWLGNWEFRVWYVKVVLYSSYFAPFSLPTELHSLHSFMNEGYVWSCPASAVIIQVSYLLGFLIFLVLTNTERS